MKVRNYLNKTDHSRSPISWLWDFLHGWFRTRDYALLLMGLPAVFVFCCAVGFWCWQHRGSDRRLVANFATAVDRALAENDTGKVVIYGEQLLRLRPDRHELRMQLVDHYAHNESKYLDRIVKHVDVLTSERVNYLPAHAWLLRQANNDAPLIPLTADQVETHCQRVLQESPGNVSARKILARQLLTDGQLKAAEDHLRTIVSTSPEVGLLLGCIQHQLKRHPDEVKGHLVRALEHFQKSILAAPNDLQLRIQFSEAATLLGRLADAERVLKDGLVRKNSPELREALSKLYGFTAAEQFRRSKRNLVSARSLFAKAIHLNPRNTRILHQALALAGSESGYAPDQLAPAVEYLKSLPAENSDHQLLFKTLLACQRLSEALQVLDTLIVNHPELITTRIELLRRLDRPEDADRLSQETLTRLAIPVTAQDRLIKAELLFMQSEFQEAQQTLQKPVSDDETDETDGSTPTGIALRSKDLGNRIALAIFDQHIQNPSSAPAVEILKLLDGPLQQKSTAGIAMNRLVAQAYRGGRLATAAKQALSGLLANGSVNAQIYSLIGAHALAAHEIKDARKYLEMAYGMGRNNPVVLNNLALAITRDSHEDKSRALELCNRALAIAPGDPQLLVTRAEICAVTADWQGARRDLEIALRKGHSTIHLRRLLIRAYTALNETDLAAEHESILKRLITHGQEPGSHVDSS